MVARLIAFYLASGAVAHPLVSALGVRVVRPRLIRGVGPGDLVRACAVRAVAGLVKLFSVLDMYGILIGSDQEAGQTAKSKK